MVISIQKAISMKNNRDHLFFCKWWVGDSSTRLSWINRSTEPVVAQQTAGTGNWDVNSRRTKSKLRPEGNENIGRRPCFSLSKRNVFALSSERVSLVAFFCCFFLSDSATGKERERERERDPVTKVISDSIF